MMLNVVSRRLRRTDDQLTIHTQNKYHFAHLKVPFLYHNASCRQIVTQGAVHTQSNNHRFDHKQRVQST